MHSVLLDAPGDGRFLGFGSIPAFRAGVLARPTPLGVFPLPLFERLPMRDVPGCVLATSSEVPRRDIEAVRTAVRCRRRRGEAESNCHQRTMH